MKRLEYIDSLRGIAIILVIIVHTTFSISNLNKSLSHLLSYGQMGVQLFFILSAITLCMSYNNDSNYSYKIQRFYLKRYFRIAPLYYIGIIIYFFINFLKNYYKTGFWDIGIYDFKNVSANLLFINDFFISDDTRNHIVPGGWSIGTEMSFYILFPFVFPLIMKSYKNLLLLFGLSIATTFFLKNIILNKWFVYQNIINMLTLFLTGILYYKYLYINKLEMLIKKKTTIIILTLAFILIAITSYLNFFNIIITPLLSGLAFIFLIDLYKHFPKLNFPFLIRIGRISYSMYIFHFIPAWYLSIFIKKYLQNLNGTISYMIMLILVVFTTYLIATISEKTIERRGILMSYKIINKYFQSKNNFNL